MEVVRQGAHRYQRDNLHHVRIRVARLVDGVQISFAELAAGLMHFAR